MKNPNLIGSRVSAKMFGYNKATKTFSQEASTLRVNCNSRLYADACDMGFVMVNPRTGAEAAFYFDREERDGEGDLLATHYASVNKMLGLKCVVFND